MEAITNDDKVQYLIEKIRSITGCGASIKDEFGAVDDPELEEDYKMLRAMMIDYEPILKEEYLEDFDKEIEDFIATS